MKESKRDSFSTIGVIVAMAGSAVGLGNMWRFPYLAGENGGAAFILIYLFFALIFSLPIMLSEFVIGRRSQANAVSSFSRLAPGSKWRYVGVLGVLTAFVILTFYSVIGGWSVEYFFKAILFEFTTKPAADYADIFTESISGVWHPILYMAIFYITTSAIVSSGVKKGIEKCSKVMMPILFLMVLAMALYSVFLPNSAEGFRYICKPDFSSVTGKTVIAAMGQAFFSLSLGMGIVITYASYCKKSTNITKNSILTIVFDTAFALLASFAIMPAVFSFGYSPGQGPGLVFITLPNLFAQMPLGSLVAVLFFSSFLLAALTSAISLLEVVVAFVVEKFHMPRRKAVIILSVIFLALASVNSLSQGVLSGFKIFGMTTLDFCDYITANFMMTIAAMLIVVFVGWKLGKPAFKEEMTNNGTLKVSQKFIDVTFFIIKYIAPLVIAAIIIFSL